jgi:hypothetical protein
MSNKSRIPDYAECVTLLGEGLDDRSSSPPEDDPEREDRPEYDGEPVAVQCGPLVGFYRVGRRRRGAGERRGSPARSGLES